ncbi:MAG TPA: hypothetical protein VEW46_11685 [Pyrinomonadaceae bacterium]|nr:hypothetical protein [Pyrinomonadaceae bacterium]
MLNIRFVFMLLLLFSVNCGGNADQVVETGAAKESASPPAPAPKKSVRNIDFNNFTYRWYPRWEYMLSNRTEFALQNGKANVEVPSGSNEPAGFEMVNVKYGDVTEDAGEEAVITIKMDVMGNSMPHVVFLYGLNDGEPKMLWSHETGDRADEGLRDVAVTSDHRLAIEQYNPDKLVSTEGDATAVGLCCPKTFTRTFYKWQNGEIQKVHEETYPNNFKDARVVVGSGIGN